MLARRSRRGHAYWALRFLTIFHLCIFGEKPYAWGRTGERLGGEWSLRWQPESAGAETGTGTFGNRSQSQMLIFLWRCSQWWAGYSPQLWLLKRTKKGSGKPFQVKLVYVFLVKALHPELLFSDSRDGRREGVCGIILEMFSFWITKLLAGVLFFSKVVKPSGSLDGGMQAFRLN